MSYAIRQDLIDRFGQQELLQLLDRDGDGIEDSGLLTRVLADADAEIDSYLSGRYTLPLSPVPARLPALACDIARYRLYATQATDEVRNRYQDAIKFLTLVAKGEVELGTNTPVATGGSPKSDAPDRVFTRDSLDDY